MREGHAVRLYMSSGEPVYVAAEPEDVIAVLEDALGSERLVHLGRAYVNPSQVAQVIVEEVPSIYTAHPLPTSEEASGE